VQPGDGKKSVLQYAMEAIEEQANSTWPVPVTPGLQIIEKHFGSDEAALRVALLKLACKCTFDQHRLNRSYDSKPIVYMFKATLRHNREIGVDTIYGAYMILGATCYNRMEFAIAESLHRQALALCPTGTRQRQIAMATIDRLHNRFGLENLTPEQAVWPNKLKEMLMRHSPEAENSDDRLLRNLGHLYRNIAKPLKGSDLAIGAVRIITEHVNQIEGGNRQVPMARYETPSAKSYDNCESVLQKILAGRGQKHASYKEGLHVLEQLQMRCTPARGGKQNLARHIKVVESLLALTSAEVSQDITRHIHLASLYRQAKDPQKAKELLEPLAHGQIQWPADQKAQLLKALALAHSDLGLYSSALIYLQAAMPLVETTSDAEGDLKEAAAEVCFAAGDFEQAARYFRQALQAAKVNLAAMREDYS
jgi:tetratricopeptide (TPR) repeat protein